MTPVASDVGHKVFDFTPSVTLKSLALDQLAQGIKTKQKPVSGKGVFKMPVKPCVRPNVPNSVFVLSRTFERG